MAHTGDIARPVVVPVDVHHDPSPKRAAAVGAQTLVGQRPPEPAPAPAPAPKPSRVRTWVKWFVDATVVPALNYVGTEWVVACVPEDYQGVVRPMAHLFSQTVARPAALWLSHQLVDALADPVTFKDSVKAGVKLAASDPVAAVRAVLPSLPSKPELGRGARELIMGSSDAAGTLLMVDLAARASGYPELATTLQTIAPQFGRAVRSLFDFGLDVACPMTTVAPEHVPKAADTLNVCQIWPATVSTAAAKLDGTYDATVTFGAGGAQPWLSLTGSATVTTGQEKRIVGISDLADAKLVIGNATKYELTQLKSAAYGEHTGWSLSAGKMIAIDGAAPATLDFLTVSPIGWIEGAFVRDGKRGLLGGMAPDGVRWPPGGAADASAPASPILDGIALSGGSPLATSIHTAISQHRTAWLMRYPMHALGWITDHANLLAEKTPDPAAVAAAREAHPTNTWMQSLDPTGLLAQIAAVDLVPSFLRSSYPKLSLDPYELKIGREPSLSFGMTTSLQLFKEFGPFRANEVVLAWLPFGSPTVQLRAAQVAFGDALDVTGLEIDPTGGLRSTRARFKVPMPTDMFSLPSIVLAADYLTVGHGMDFRNASMTAQQIAIGDFVTVKELVVAITESGADPRLAATVIGGEAHVPGVTRLVFGGTLNWGAGRSADGNGTLVGEGLTALGGKITAQALAGTLDVRAGVATGTIAATDLVVAYNDYLLKTTASVTVDRHGLAKFSIDALEVWKANAKVGAASNVEYERGKTLTVGAFALDLPETGALRATKADASGATPQLVMTDLDLSSFVRTPTPAPAKRSGLALTNLARLELGPTGIAPYLALDFTKTRRDEIAPDAKPAAEGAIAAVVSGDLRGFTLTPTLVEVERSSTNESDVRVTLAGINGTGYSIKKATYDDGKLDVTDASVQLDVLLGSNVPDALRGLVSRVQTTFAIDTRANKLLALRMDGALAGTLFGGAVTIKDATAALVASPGRIAAGALANGLALSGEIAGTVSAKLYGVEATLTGSVAFPSGIAKLSGRGSGGPVTVEVSNVSFGNGNPIFESAKATIAPPVTNLVDFVAWKDKLVLSEEDRGRVVVVVAKKLAVEPASGAPVAAASEQVVATPSPTAPTAPAMPSTGREIGVHVPQIHIHGDAFRLVAHDVVVPEGTGRKTVTLEAEAALKLGMLVGGMKGTVTMTLPGGAPASADETPGTKVVAAPEPGSIAFEVTDATIGGLVMKNLRYEHGVIKIATTTVPTPKLLGGFPRTLGLEGVTWTANNLEIDVPGRSVKVGSLATTVSDISCLGGALTIASATAEVGSKPSELDKASLIPQSWALTLTATDAKIGVPGLRIGGSAKVVIDRTGLVGGELTGGSFQCGVGETSVGKVELTPDGWDAKDVTLVLGNTTELGFGSELLKNLPSWLAVDTDYQVRAKFPLAHRAKNLVWPSLSQIEIDVLKAGISLPGIKGAFERTKAKKTASLAMTPLTGGFQVGLKIPLAHGVGIEISGGLDHSVSLAATDIALTDGDHLGFAGKVAGKASLKGRVRVGVFGGVPALFTVSAGVYAGINLDATLAADASGAWNLPKVPGKGSSGAVELYLSMNDPTTNKGAMLTGEAGAYASINVLGFGRTIEKSLATVEIAELIAHGFARIDTAHGMTLLPTGGFPAHVLHLHPALENLLTGGDTQQAIALAQKTVDRGVGKMEASEELLLSAKSAAAGDKPWEAASSALDAKKATAAAAVVTATNTAKATKLVLVGDRECLEMAHKKLANHERKLAELKLGKTVRGRAVKPGGLAIRLLGYENHQGLVADTTALTADQLRDKIAAKKEEIAVFEKRIATEVRVDLAGRDKLATAVNTNHKATRKAELATKTKHEVELDLERRQLRLIAMYGTLQQAHKKAVKQVADRSGKTVKLTADQETATKRLELLKTDPAASLTEVKFWTQQLKFVTAELELIKVQAEPAPILMSPEATAAFERAKKAQPEALAALSAVIDADVHQHERTIEVTTDKLAANFEALSELALTDATFDARAKLEKKRKDLLVTLETAQVQLAGALERAAAVS